MRLHSAVISRVWSPSTSSPIGLSTTISIRAASAESRVRASASSTTSSMSTRDSSGSPSAPVSRDSAISSVTRLPEPVRLADDLGAEPADLGGVVGGVEHGLGEQPDRTHGRLELVADVGHEVAAGGLQPHGVGACRWPRPSCSRRRAGAPGASTAAGRRPRWSSGDRSTATAVPRSRTSAQAAIARASGLSSTTTPSSQARALASTAAPLRSTTTSPSSVAEKTRCRRSPSAGADGTAVGGTTPRLRPHRRPTAMPAASASAATSTQTTPVMTPS